MLVSVQVSVFINSHVGVVMNKKRDMYTNHPYTLTCPKILKLVPRSKFNSRGYLNIGHAVKLFPLFFFAAVFFFAFVAAIFIFTLPIGILLAVLLILTFHVLFIAVIFRG